MSYKLLLILCLLVPLINAQIHPLKFESNKQNINNGLGGPLKYEFLRTMKEIFQIDTFIETGTYSGDTTLAAAQIFPAVHTIELDTKLYNAAAKRFQSNSKIYLYRGSSPEIFIQLIPKINNRILFWLDAHYSGPGTAQDTTTKNESDAITAIRRELEAIKSTNIKNCVILIDDIRGFGTYENGEVYLGCWAYPTIQEVKHQLLQINENFEVYLLGDTLLAYDNTIFSVPVSKVVQACTKSRLLNVSSDFELLEAEKTISNSLASERQFLDNLCKDMNQYSNKDYHHYLWHGLLKYKEGNYKEAQKCFSRIINESNYRNWRIYWYLAQTEYVLNNKEKALEYISEVLAKNSTFEDALALKKIICE